ncbi:hypothetical protein PIB30_080345 [Stylosanthes scabra]|uniref:Uncharacterized protein n=1 Tax=Stylosanthes scabra TaxID=79078 RepID=A0ABU6URG1_9FABA|nr:hypothetical protein [Stylosanthes scabra]
MGSSRERWSASNRDGGRDGGDGEGWSVTKRSSESASAMKKKSKFLAPECKCGAYAILFMSSTLEILIGYSMGAHTSRPLHRIVIFLLGWTSTLLPMVQ